jgi:hypothetical protein
MEQPSRLQKDAVENQEKLLDSRIGKFKSKWKKVSQVDANGDISNI